MVEINNKRVFDNEYDSEYDLGDADNMSCDAINTAYEPHPKKRKLTSIEFDNEHMFDSDDDETENYDSSDDSDSEADDETDNVSIADELSDDEDALIYGGETSASRKRELKKAWKENINYRNNTGRKIYL